MWVRRAFSSFCFYRKHDERYRPSGNSASSTTSSDIKSERSEVNSPLSSSHDEDDMDFTDKDPDLPDSDSEDEEIIDPGSHDDELKATPASSEATKNNAADNKTVSTPILPAIQLDANRCITAKNPHVSNILPLLSKQTEKLP